MQSKMNPRLQLALNIALDAAALIRQNFANTAHVMNVKSGNDFATDTDIAVETMIAKHIAARFPGDVLLGEEGGERLLGGASSSSGFRWIVDPLDGTFNFAHHFPYIACSMAIEHQGAVIAGVIVNPINGEIFYAEQGGGAWLIGGATKDAPPLRLRVSQADTLAAALVGSVLPSAANAAFDAVFAAWSIVAKRSGSIRRTGAAALDLAHVAAGRMDGFFVMSLASWDAAAGALLVKEAGGMVCDFSGGQQYLQSNQVIAGTHAVAGALVDALHPFHTNIHTKP